MPGSNNRMTQEQFENEQMESFNRIRSNIQARIVELEGAVEGSNEYDELQQLRNDLNDLESNIQLWRTLRNQIAENRQSRSRTPQRRNNPSYLLRNVNLRLDELRNKYDDVRTDPTPEPVPTPEQTQDTPSVEGIEVIRKSEIRDRIDAYEQGSTYENEKQIRELSEQIQKILDEHGMTDAIGQAVVRENEGQLINENYPEDVRRATEMRNEIRNLAAQRSNTISQRGEDVLPVLRELESLENVPGLDFEAIYASEVDTRIENYREDLARLHRNDPRQQLQDNRRRQREIESRVNEINNLIGGLEPGRDAVRLENLLNERSRLGREYGTLRLREEQWLKLNPTVDMTDEELLQENDRRQRIGEVKANKERLENELQAAEMERQAIRSKYQDGMTQDEEENDPSAELDELEQRISQLRSEIEKADAELANDNSEFKDVPQELITDALDRRAKQNREQERLENIIDELESLQRERAVIKDIEKENDPEYKGGDTPGHGGDGSEHGEGDGSEHGEGDDSEREGGDGPEHGEGDDSEREGEDGPEHGGGDDSEHEGEDDPEHEGGDDPEHEGEDDPEHEGEDDPEHEGEDDQKKSPRHWVEIMAETQTQSSGSITTAFHKVGKIQPFRMGLTIWMAPMKLAMKGAGKLFGDVLGRAESKKREMVENVRGLSDEEFEILVNGLTETNMRQYKVNEIYLDAVQEVLEERENAKKQAAINDDNVIKSALAQTEDRMNEIDKELQDPAILPDRKLELESEKAKCAITYSVLNIQHNAAYNREMEADKRMTDFDRGKVGKSTRKMNIQGWFAGSFNPDNREVHQEEAKYRKEAREAADRGDTVAVVEAQRKIDEIQEENTNVIQFLEGTRFESRARINRGKHTVEEVHSRANDADQTKGRELMATAMAAVTFANMYKTWQANQDMQQQVDAHLNQHNQEVRNVNAQNQQVQQSIDNANAHNSQLGQDISATKSSVSSQEINQAGIGEIHRNNAATYSVRHEAEFVRDNTPGIGFNHGGSDEAIHAAQAGMTQARQNAENGGFASIQQEVQASAARVQDAAKDVLPDIQGFTSIAGKSGYINSEYVTNLQSIVNGSPDNFTLLSNLFSSVQKLGDPAQVVGTIGDVSEIAPLVLSTSSGTMMNILPFVTAMANATHLEVQKSKMNLERQRQEQREKQAQKEAKKDEPEKNIDDNDGR